MDKALKQRLVGATVLIILTVIVLPMLLSGRSDTLSTESRQIELPPKPEELSFETRRFPVGIPNKAATADGQGEQENNAGNRGKSELNQAAELAVDSEGAVNDNTAAVSPPENSARTNELVQTGADGAEPGPSTEVTSPLPADSGQAEATAPPMDTVATPPAVTTVIIDPRENSKGVEPDAAGVSQPGSRYLVQVASFSSEKRANAMADELRAGKLPVVMDVVDRTAGQLHRVRVGPFAQRSEADAVVVKIRDMNKDLSPRVMDTRPGDGAPVSAPSDPLVRWVVQLGSYNNPATAESEVAKLRLAGLTAFSVKVTSAGTITYKVLVGPEIDQPKAVQLKEEIKAKHGIDGFVRTQE